MTKEYTPEEIKYRLSDLGVQIGNIAINYITELEKACDEAQELLDKQIEATYKLDKENAELKEKFLTIKSDDVRKSKLNECKTYEDKIEYLRQVSNYALFNDDISVMLWCFCQRGEIDKDQLTTAKELIKNIIRVTWGEGWNYSLDWKVKAESFIKEVEK